MKIFLSEFAEQRLIEIYLYYAEHASDKVAERLLNSIFDKILSLKTAPLIGSPDEYLTHLNKGHRKVFRGNYKIVYRIAGTVIYIIDIFDSRQHPDKQKSDG